MSFIKKLLTFAGTLVLLATVAVGVNKVQIQQAIKTKAAGNTYYVATAGNDANSATSVPTQTLSPTSIPTQTPQPTPLPTTSSLRDPENPQSVIEGLDYHYYEGTWKWLPDLNVLTPIKSGSINNFDLSLSDLEDFYAFMFMGYIDVPLDGSYAFYLNSDDESKLFIGGTEVVSSNWDKGEQVGIIGLKKGKHAIAVYYYEYDWTEYLEVGFSGPGIEKQPIPDSNLFRSQPSIPGDANGDGIVDGVDYVTWLRNFGTNTQNGPQDGDFNQDSKVDGVDYVIWLRNVTI